MNIEYKINAPISVDQFLSLLEQSSLSERRPVEDRDCIAGMIAHSNLLVSAWDQGHLVGAARCLTDFHYVCYLSDLAVAESHQGQGIGRQLQSVVQQQLGPRGKLLLVSAPAANSYYEQLGYEEQPRCWVRQSGNPIV